jgi:hypothetical protein
MRAVIFAVLAVLVVLVLLQVRKVPEEAKVKVYGSMDCPWTVKQLNNLEGRAEFFDCKNFKCPDFVKGYPTCEKDGQVFVGYQEGL